MRIRALTSFAGPYGAFSESDEGDVEHEVGKSWVKAGLAEEVKAKGKGKKGQKDDELFGADEE